MIFITSCDKEVIRLNGNINGVSDSDSHILVKVKSRTGQKERILDTIQMKKGEFEFYTKAIKPPVKLTFLTEDSCELDIWVGEYGSKTIEAKIHPKVESKVLGSFFCDELIRMNNNLQQMYLEPIKNKEKEARILSEIGERKVLSEENKLRLLKLNKNINSAIRLRKKSILKTARKNSNNPVAIALMCQEFDRLTSHQKKECYKYLSKSFGDTGLNWQMKN